MSQARSRSIAARFFENTPVPVAESRVKTIAEEAAIYLRVNGSGTPQSAEDIARAAGIAAAEVENGGRDS